MLWGLGLLPQIKLGVNVADSSLAENARAHEWAVIYGELKEGLSVLGRENPFGGGDFFIVDDDYGTHQHKIECTSPTFFTPAAVAATQSILLNYSPQWEVIFVVTGRVPGSSVYVVRSKSWTLVT